MAQEFEAKKFGYLMQLANQTLVLLKINFELKYLKGPSIIFLVLMFSEVSTLGSIRKHLVSAGATKLGFPTTVRSTVNNPCNWIIYLLFEDF